MEWKTDEYMLCPECGGRFNILIASSFRCARGRAQFRLTSTPTKDDLRINNARRPGASRGTS